MRGDGKEPEKILSAMELERIRRRWESDIGTAAKDVVRVLDYSEELLGVTTRALARDAIMFGNLSAVQERCTALFEEKRTIARQRDAVLEVLEGVLNADSECLGSVMTAARDYLRVERRS